MKIKHKNEWPILVNIARKNNLDDEQTIILLAYREIIDGKEGVEFHKLDSLERTFESQSILMAKEIKEKEFFYQAYIKRLEPEAYIEDFIEYIEKNKAYRLKRYVDLISKEFSSKENK